MLSGFLAVVVSGRKLCLGGVAAALAFAGSISASADQVVLSPTRDCTLYENSNGLLANGSGSYIFAGRTAQSSGFSIRRGLLAFDIASNIPAGSTINSATLTVHVSRAATDDAVDVSLHRVTTDWNEGPSDAAEEEGMGAIAMTGDTTWRHTYFNNQFWDNDGGDFLPGASATIEMSDLGSYSWSDSGMVADVQSWLDNAGQNFGWLVLNDESVAVTVKRFDSREVSTPATRPTLTIDFTPPSDCAADITDSSNGPPDGTVNLFDLLALLDAWGVCEMPAECPADLTDSKGAGPDGTVNLFDLLALLDSWGDCS